MRNNCTNQFYSFIHAPSSYGKEDMQLLLPLGPSTVSSSFWDKVFVYSNDEVAFCVSNGRSSHYFPTGETPWRL